MTKQQRGQLLRARFRALGGIPIKIPPCPVEAKPAPLRSKQTGRSQPFYGVALADTRTEWVQRPDAEQKKLLGARNREGKPIVVRLAKLAPAKLILDRERLNQGLGLGR